MLTKTTNAEIGHKLIDKGWSVLAVKANSKQPHTKYSPKGFHSSTISHDKLDEWFSKSPELNLGINCVQSGLVVLDFDKPAMNETAWDVFNFCDLNYYDDTYVVHTGNGIHYYFEVPQGYIFKGKLLPGIDIKYNGYVVAEGSTHENGTIYQQHGSKDPMQIPQRLLRKMIK